MWTNFSPFAGLYLINTKVGHACYFDFDILIELEVFLKMLDAAKIQGGYFYRNIVLQKHVRAARAPYQFIKKGHGNEEIKERNNRIFTMIVNS